MPGITPAKNTQDSVIENSVMRKMFCPKICEAKRNASNSTVRRFTVCTLALYRQSNEMGGHRNIMDKQEMILYFWLKIQGRDHVRDISNGRIEIVLLVDSAAAAAVNSVESAF
jgi:hypothetical protein